MKYIYEFIGTFFLVLTVGMTVLGGNNLLAPLAIGSILMVMVFAGGHVSGAHYNPAVSFAIFLRGKLAGRELIKYWVVQLVAAIIASYLTIYLKGSRGEPISFKVVPALIAEFVFTFALCFVVLNVATTKKLSDNSFFGLAIGFTVVAGAYAVGTISGAAFNPAVALGITIMNLNVWSHLWVYIVATLLGGAAAAYAYPAEAKKAH